VKHLLLIILCSPVFSCMSQERIYIVTGQNKFITETGKDLAGLLLKTYPANQFEVIKEEVSGKRNMI